MEKRFKTLWRRSEAEVIVEKSRFIGYAKPIQNEEEAVAFIEEVKALHKSANHHVPIYVLGDHYEIQRYSDDGEPSGTAGIPILEMVKKEGIKNLVIVITRYFGGIKLGTGGLVRAYTAAAKSVISESKVIEKVLHDLTKVRLEYHLLGKVQNSILNNGYPIKETIFDDAVNIYTYTEVDKTDDFIKTITDITSGKAIITIEYTEYRDLLDGKPLKE